jgi:predicted porin
LEINMKKSLIALAVLAASGAVLAQSSVTLYGRIDTSIGSEKTLAGTTSKVFSGNLTTSRYGFRGTEDLGGGLRAQFQLENGFNADDGTLGTANTAFNRASWVGLAGGFGQVRLGLIDSPYKDIFDMGVSNALYDSEFTPNKIAYTGVGNSTSRLSNSVRYDTPSLGGISGAVSFNFDETAGVKNDITALNLRYRAGKLDVGFAYQDQKNTVAASDREYSVLSAAYNLGVARVSAQYQNSKQANGLKDNEYVLGVLVPLGTNIDVSLAYADSKGKLNGATTSKGTAFSFGGTYSLSKRTRLYGAYLTGDVENARGVKTADRTLYAVGVRHDF